MHYESCNLRVDTYDRIATLRLDLPGPRPNTLTTGVLNELEEVFRRLRMQAYLEILVIRTARPTGFLLGPDPLDVRDLSDTVTAQEFARRGQEVFDLLADLSSAMRTVAVIDGMCHGAGLELALACDYRLAVARPTTTIGMPQVSAGFLPCWGGTVRLTRLLGDRTAAELLLTGKLLTARQAKRIGLVDHAFCEKRAKIEIRSFLDLLQDEPLRRRTRPLSRRLIEGVGLLRRLALRSAERLVAERDPNEQPVYQAIYETIRAGLTGPRNGFLAERRAFADLIATPACRNGLTLLLDADQSGKLFPEPINPIPNIPERIGLVGAGDLGSRLAVRLVLAGRNVVIREAGEVGAALARRRIDKLLDDAIEQGLVTPLEADQAKRGITLQTSRHDFDRVGLVIEAIDEDFDLKRQVLTGLEETCRPRTILATTTSTLSIEQLQRGMKRPGRLAGLHFVSPFATPALVEIVRGKQTDTATLAALESWCRRLGQTPLLTADRAGRIIQRLLLAYLSEAVLLVAEGLPIADLDAVMRKAGMTVGPLELLDTIGFERLAQQARALTMVRGDHFAANLLLERMRVHGWQGKINGEGFWRWRGDRKTPNELARVVLWNDLDPDAIHHYIVDPQAALRDARERLILRTINEAADCLAEEPLGDPAVIDLGAALGFGWLPQHGGPLRYADSLGINALLERLSFCRERFGPRFTPADEIERRADLAENFYGASRPLAVALPNRSLVRKAS